MIEGVRWKLSCKWTKSPVLSHWIIIALEASDILRDKFSMRVIIQCPYYGSDKKVASFILEAILGEPFHSVMSNLKNYRDRIFPCAVKKKKRNFKDSIDLNCYIPRLVCPNIVKRCFLFNLDQSSNRRKKWTKRKKENRLYEKFHCRVNLDRERKKNCSLSEDERERR